MIHYIFATELEASPFTEGLDFVQSSPLSYYETTDYRVFISGVGLLKSATKLRQYFEEEVKSGDRVINAGIAGAVNTDLELYAVYEVASIRLYDPRTFADADDPRFDFYKAEYPSLEFKTEGLSLASSLYPIWHEADRELLQKNSIDLVDMEAYSIAEVAKDFDFDFSIVKAVSDFTAKPSEKDFLENARLAVDSLHKKLRQN